MIVVFLGPSLDITEAQRLLPAATFRPPARQGDIVSLVPDEPTAVGLIDGEFHQSRSVWHKEIMLALDRGVHVFGASSMGALRAAELHPSGMVGIGNTFDAFASGELIDDDEVALLYHHDGSTYTPLSEPMVNIRATIRAGRRCGVLPEDIANAALEEAKSLHYPHRTRAEVVDRLRTQGFGDAEMLSAYWRDHGVDQKAEDARELLRVLRSFAADPPPRPSRDARLHWTPSLDTLYDRERRVRISRNHASDHTEQARYTGEPDETDEHEPEAEAEVSLGDIAEFVQIHHPDPERLRTGAMNRALVGVLATLLDISPGEEDIDSELDRWRSRHGLVSEATLQTWLRTNHLTISELRQLASEAASGRLLARWMLYWRQAERNTRLVLDHLRWENEYEPWAGRAAALSLLEESDEERIDTFLATTPEEAVHEHREWTGVPIPTGLVDWAEEAGWNTPQDLFLTLAKAKAVRLRLLERLEAALTLDTRSEQERCDE